MFVKPLTQNAKMQLIRQLQPPRSTTLIQLFLCYRFRLCPQFHFIVMMLMKRIFIYLSTLKIKTLS